MYASRGRDAKAAPRRRSDRPEPVVRRGVEIAHAELPGRIDRRPRVVVGYLAVEVAELGAAERELAEGVAPFGSRRCGIRRLSRNQNI